MIFFTNEKIFFYIFFELVISFFISSFIFLFVLLMFDFIQLIEFFLIYQVSYSLVFQMTKELIIQAIPFVLPMSCLLSTITIYGKLAYKSELIAFLALGFKKTQLLLSALVLGLLVFWFHIQFSFQFSPRAKTNLEQMKTEVRASKISALLRPGVFIRDFENLILYAEIRNSKENKIQNIFIKDERDPETPITVIAESAEFLKEDKENSIPKLKLHKGSFHVSQNKNHIKAQFDSYEMNIFSSGLESGDGNLSSYTYAQLMAELKSSEKLKEKQKWRVAVNERWAFPFSCILLSFLGGLIGFTNKQRKSTNILASSFIVITMYWILHAFFTNISQSQTMVHAGLSAWFANFILLFLLIHLMLKRRI